MVQCAVNENIEVAQLSGGDAMGQIANFEVVLGPSMCGVGALCMNNNCGDLYYSMDFLHLTKVPRSLMDHVQLVWVERLQYSQQGQG